jgi:hypothetical protein
MEIQNSTEHMALYIGLHWPSSHQAHQPSNPSALQPTHVLAGKGGILRHFISSLRCLSNGSSDALQPGNLFGVHITGQTTTASGSLSPALSMWGEGGTSPLSALPALPALPGLSAFSQPQRPRLPGSGFEVPALC